MFLFHKDSSNVRGIMMVSNEEEKVHSMFRENPDRIEIFLGVAQTAVGTISGVFIPGNTQNCHTFYRHNGSLGCTTVRHTGLVYQGPTG
jgi:hypothetical protein